MKILFIIAYFTLNLCNPFNKKAVMFSILLNNIGTALPSTKQLLIPHRVLVAQVECVRAYVDVTIETWFSLVQQVLDAAMATKHDLALHHVSIGCNNNEMCCFTYLNMNKKKLLLTKWSLHVAVGSPLKLIKYW